jgi:uncharacterized protein YjeT (DUF2065 family)
MTLALALAITVLEERLPMLFPVPWSRQLFETAFTIAA